VWDSALILWLISRFPPMMDVFQFDNQPRNLGETCSQLKWRQYLFNNAKTHLARSNREKPVREKDIWISNGHGLLVRLQPNSL